MNKNFSFPLVVTIIVALAILVIVGVVGYQRYLVSKEKTELPQIETPKDETAGWEMYTSPNGYQIKYPKSYLRLICPDEDLSLVKRRSGDDRPGPIEMSGCGRDARYPLEIITYDSILNEPQEGKTEYYIEYYLIEKAHITLDGLQATQYIFTNRNSVLLQSYILVYLNKNGRTIEFYFDDKDSIGTFNQILSTFKFTDSSDSTVGWETYKNTEYGFEIKYPSQITFSVKGPNDVQQALNRGEQISGTEQPSYQTIIFSDGNNGRGKIDIFHKYEDEITKENYKDKGYLYLYGPCDIRWGFVPDTISLDFINDVKILTTQGYKEGVPNNCYYFKNLSGNLIVISNILSQILSTFRFLE